MLWVILPRFSSTNRIIARHFPPRSAHFFWRLCVALAAVLRPRLLSALCGRAHLAPTAVVQKIARIEKHPRAQFGYLWPTQGGSNDSTAFTRNVVRAGPRCCQGFLREQARI